MLKHEKQSHWPLCSQLLVQKSAAAHSLLQTDCCVHCCRWCGVHLSVPGGFSFRLFAGSQLHEGAWARGHLDTLAETARWQGTQGAAGNGQSPQLLMLLECVVVLLRALCWSWGFLFFRADSLRAAEVHMLWHQICAALSTTCSGEWSQEGQSLLSLISHGEMERMVCYSYFEVQLWAVPFSCQASQRTRLQRTVLGTQPLWCPQCQLMGKNCFGFFFDQMVCSDLNHPCFMSLQPCPLASTGWRSWVKRICSHTRSSVLLVPLTLAMRKETFALSFSSRSATQHGHCVTLNPCAATYWHYIPSSVPKSPSECLLCSGHVSEEVKGK